MTTVLICRFGARSEVRIGDEIDVALDPGSFHFFDLETGRAISAQAG
jgi:hypothetical protein